MHDRLRERARKLEGRAREPLAAVVEARPKQSTDNRCGRA